MSGKVGGKHPVKDPPTAATSEEVGSKRKKREEESRGEQLSWKDGGPSSGGAERRTHKGTGFDHRIAIKNTQASGGYVGAKDDGRTPVQREGQAQPQKSDPSIIYPPAPYHTSTGWSNEPPEESEAAKATEEIKLDPRAVCYLIGRNGSTKFRLHKYSECGIFVNDGDEMVILRGTKKQRERARLGIKITMQQKDGGTIHCNFKGLEQDPDTTTLDVPCPAVGFVMGFQGTRLRDLENLHSTFMFFDNDTIHDGGRKRLYVLGNESNRDHAVMAVSGLLMKNMAMRGIEIKMRTDEIGGQKQIKFERVDRDGSKSPSKPVPTSKSKGNIMSWDTWLGDGRRSDRDRRRSRSPATSSSSDNRRGNRDRRRSPSPNNRRGNRDRRRSRSPDNRRDDRGRRRSRSPLLPPPRGESSSSSSSSSSFGKAKPRKSLPWREQQIPSAPVTEQRWQQQSEAFLQLLQRCYIRLEDSWEEVQLRCSGEADWTPVVDGDLASISLKDFDDDARQLVLEGHRSKLRAAKARADARRARRDGFWAMLSADPAVGPDTLWEAVAGKYESRHEPDRRRFFEEFKAIGPLARSATEVASEGATEGMSEGASEDAAAAEVVTEGSIKYSISPEQPPQKAQDYVPPPWASIEPAESPKNDVEILPFAELMRRKKEKEGETKSKEEKDRLG